MSNLETLEGRVIMKPEVFLADDYRPAEDEPFMNDRQLEYFKRKLLIWKADLMSDSKDTIEGLQDSTRNIPDIADRASEETDRALELRTRDRQRKLVAKVMSESKDHPNVDELHKRVNKLDSKISIETV